MTNEQYIILNDIFGYRLMKEILPEDKPIGTKNLKLLTAIALALSAYDSNILVRAWFISPCPYLVERTPLELVKTGKYVQVLDAILSRLILGN